ncbi:hypothetical protein C0J52_21607 [Blattella germanica]|nr:hypothetical protein C0J52_21607 [Blattella germanica]
MRLGYSEKSAVTQHSYDSGHRIIFCETSIWKKSSKYFDRIIKEAIYFTNKIIILTGKKVFKQVMRGYQ